MIMHKTMVVIAANATVHNFILFSKNCGNNQGCIPALRCFNIRPMPQYLVGKVERKSSSAVLLTTQEEPKSPRSRRQNDSRCR